MVHWSLLLSFQSFWEILLTFRLDGETQWAYGQLPPRKYGMFKDATKTVTDLITVFVDRTPKCIFVISSFRVRLQAVLELA